MRYRIKKYSASVSNNVVTLSLGVPDGMAISINPEDGSLDPADERFIKESVRLIIDETNKVVLCSSMQKDRIINIYAQGIQGESTVDTIYIYIAIPDGKTVSASDQFTIEMDWGDTIKDNIPTDYAKPSHITEGVNEIKNFLGVAGSGGEGEFQALSMQEIFDMCDDIDTAILGENHPGLVTAEDHAAIIAAINIDGDIEWNDYVNSLTE